MITTKELIEEIYSQRVKNVILDCDTGADGDDQFALAYLLASDDRVNLLGVTSEPFNENSDETVAAGAKENQYIISLAEKNVPSVVGSHTYITKLFSDSESVRVSEKEDLCRSDLTENKRKSPTGTLSVVTAKNILPVRSNAADFIIEKALEAEETLYIVLSGCCTNVASAIMLCPEIKDKIAVVWLAMSDIYGQYPGEEYNFQNDPVAGHYLVNSGVPFLLVPTKHIYPFRKSKDEVDALFSGEGKLCRYLRERYREITWAQGLWDLGAVAAFTLPEAYEIKEIFAPVLDRKGRVIAYDGRRTIAYAVSLNTSAVLSDAVNKLNKI